MKKRLLSMLMAVLMIASLVPATALAAGTDDHAKHDVLSVNIAVDAAKKQPGIVFEYCNTDSTEANPVILKDLEVTPFAEASDICLRHSTKTVELQAATCDKPSIKLTYCPVCGTAASEVAGWGAGPGCRKSQLSGGYGRDVLGFQRSRRKSEQHCRGNGACSGRKNEK